MGLGAPKRRDKLSHDPNNTTWSRSTTTFGHRILSRQGWTPGAYLGASDAAHASHYTAANASHIRVLLREENLGLGAKIGGNKAETFGLSLFSGVLGRLNGKSEDVLRKEEERERDRGLAMYCERKFGMVGFVRGGWLVGDKMQAEREERKESAEHTVVDEAPRSKKRKADDDLAATDSASSSAKKQKKDKKAHSEKPKEFSEPTEQDEDQSEDSEAQTAVRASTKSKKKRSKTVDEASSADSEKAARKQARTEKRARKEERRKRREEKAAHKANKSATTSTHSTPTDTEAESTATPQASRSGTATPSIDHRQAVRRRYIQQKRMASMDPQAMKEIFMVKAGA